MFPVASMASFFFKINNPEKAVLEVEEFKFKITQLCCPERCLWKDQIRYYSLKKRRNGQNIKEIVEKETKEWGIQINDVKIKDI